MEPQCTGCFTCKFRKFRCVNEDVTLEGVSSVPTARSDICSNCERLGLDCRWSAPTNGEQYKPPPKRRRTALRSQITSGHEPSAHNAASLSSFLPDTGTETQLPGNVVSDTTDGAPRDQRRAAPPVERAAPLDPMFAVDFGDFDMDIAFDGLEYMLPTSFFPDQLQAPTAQGPAIATDHHEERLRAPPSVTDENRHLIQYYIDVLQEYSKVTDRPKDPNVFISAFSESLSFPPLFYSILSFSSAHLAMNDDSFTGQADMYDRLSTESLEAFLHQETPLIEGLLSAIFIRAKKEHVTAGRIDRFLDLMRLAADMLSGEHGRAYLDDLSPLGRRTIVRIAVLDARAATYRVGGGQFLRRICALPALAELLTENRRLDYTADGIMCLLQVGLLRLRVADLESRLHQQLSSDFFSGLPVRVDEVRNLYAVSQSRIDDWETSMKSQRQQYLDNITAGEDVTLDAMSYRDYTVLSALHSVLLYLHLVFVSLLFSKCFLSAPF